MSVYSTRTKSSTPSSILKKTPSLKKRLSEIASSTPSKVRFVLPHSKRVREILTTFQEEKTSKDYQNLVCLIRDAVLTDDDVSALLIEANDCISLLGRDLRLFVDALMSISWVDKSPTVVKEYQSFVINLISAHNYHAIVIVNKLVALFVPPATEPEWENGVPTQGDCVKCQNVHSLFSVLLQVVPMCKEILMQSLGSQFPYFKRPTHVIEYYLQNLLWVITYQPLLRPDILHIIFSNLVILDVNAPREEIERFETGDEDIFPMDDSKSVFSAVTAEGEHAVAHTLDVCLDKLINYFVLECHDKEQSSGSTTGITLNWDKTKDLYRDMLAVFDRVILPTYNTHHVQFVVFVLCSFKTSLVEGFLNFLWKKVCNPNVPPVIRQASVNYIVSMLARATFVPLTMVKGSLQQISDWIHSYMSTQDGLDCVNSDVRVHSVFYAVCQALFYVVAFRQNDLFSSKKNVTFLEGLNMAKIVTSRLNPLRACQPAVIQNFAAITRKFQLAYCYSIMEHNSRNTLPTIYKDEKGSVVISNNILDSFYPFEPYILKKSSAKIVPHYRDYTEISLDGSDVEMREFGEVGDDFLDEFGFRSKSGRSKKFSYGASPGFKFK